MSPQLAGKNHQERSVNFDNYIAPRKYNLFTVCSKITISSKNPYLLVFQSTNQYSTINEIFNVPTHIWLKLIRNLEFFAQTGGTWPILAFIFLDFWGTGNPVDIWHYTQNRRKLRISRSFLGLNACLCGEFQCPTHFWPGYCFNYLYPGLSDQFLAALRSQIMPILMGFW